MKDLNNCEKQFLKYVLGEMLAGHYVGSVEEGKYFTWIVTGYTTRLFRNEQIPFKITDLVPRSPKIDNIKRIANSENTYRLTDEYLKIKPYGVIVKLKSDENSIYIPESHFKLFKDCTENIKSDGKYNVSFLDKSLTTVGSIMLPNILGLKMKD